MKRISKDNLVKVLQILYKVWNREFPNDYPSKHYIEWDGGEPYNFYMKYQKQLSLGGETDDFYYWMNALLENEDNLDEDTLSVDNVIVPKYYTYTIETEEERRENVTVYYEGEVEGYFTEDQLQRSFYELGSDVAFDYYDFSESDRYYSDGEGDGINLKEIRLVDEEISESKKNKKIVTESDLDLFINSLTESETKFLIERLQKKLI
jgi:hypothetical protein